MSDGNWLISVHKILIYVHKMPFCAQIANKMLNVKCCAQNTHLWLQIIYFMTVLCGMTI